MGLEQPDGAARDPAGTLVLGEQVYGELDRAANSPATFPDPIRFSVPALYAAVKGPQKRLAGAGHSLAWETTAKDVHQLIPLP
ncbi:hypothetical protein [Streptomyces sp. NPDC050416]|uniref:hypothetical protein n=1 Tax=Streptomyces sp. NPDC050416 TaxID=3365611 RepID=UPI0037ADB580